MINLNDSECTSKVTVKSATWLHLRLDVRNFAPAELKLIERHVGLPKVAQKAEFFGPEDEQRVAFAALAASCSADAVDVLLGIIWRIKLQTNEEEGDTSPLL